MSDDKKWVDWDIDRNKPLNTPSYEEIVTSVRRYWREVNQPGGLVDAVFPTDDPVLRAKYSELEIEDKMEDMADEGILEYGVSVRTAWIVGEETTEDDLSPETMRILSKIMGDRHE